MNTISLVLNGRTAASIAQLPEKQAASITTLYSRPGLKQSPSSSGSTTPTAPRTPSLSSGMSTPRRPTYRRSQGSRSSVGSRDSPGWYNTDDNMTLDDFARRLSSRLGRFEQWQGRCAQNVVMALMRPTPLVLFVFNPVSMMLWIGLLLWWISCRQAEG